jgi:hypothetical protein
MQEGAAFRRLGAAVALLIYGNWATSSRWR